MASKYRAEHYWDATLLLSDSFIDTYIASRKDAKLNTIRNFKNSRGKLIDYFGEDALLDSIRRGDADEWRQSLVNNGLSEATICKAVKHAKQFFKLAFGKNTLLLTRFMS